ncbi:MAG TPA: PadR family transcriptional regulator [Bacillota bacterium]
MGRSSNLTPLTEASYYVLISLVEPLHGYGIMQKVDALTGGRVKIGPGTLYGALGNLESAGLIRRCGDAGAGDRRKAYVLTEMGRRVAESEVARLEAMVKHGRTLLNGGGVAGEDG